MTYNHLDIVNRLEDVFDGSGHSFYYSENEQEKYADVSIRLRDEWGQDLAVGCDLRIFWDGEKVTEDYTQDGYISTWDVGRSDPGDIVCAVHDDLNMLFNDAHDQMEADRVEEEKIDRIDAIDGIYRELMSVDAIQDVVDSRKARTGYDEDDRVTLEFHFYEYDYWLEIDFSPVEQHTDFSDFRIDICSESGIYRFHSGSQYESDAIHYARDAVKEVEKFIAEEQQETPA